MADASLRSRLEAAQARRAQLAGRLARELPRSAEHQRALAESAALSLAVSTAEGRLVEADGKKPSSSSVAPGAGRSRAS